MKRLCVFSLICLLCLLCACQAGQLQEQGAIQSTQTSPPQESPSSMPSATATVGLTPISGIGISPICSLEEQSAAIASTYAEAPIQMKDEKYTAAWFVAPSALNMPHEVLLTPQGELLVQSNGSNQLFQIFEDGSLSLFAEQVSGYYGDVDEEGNIYLYDFVTGSIIRIGRDGGVRKVVESKQISTACDSGFALADNGNFYLALNPCRGNSNLYEISLDGEIRLVLESIPNLQALKTNPEGNLSGVSPNGSLYEIRLENYSLSKSGKIQFTGGWMEYVSAGGLAFDPDGNMYISTCGRCNSGRVYQVDEDGKSALWADVPNNGLSGIEWLPQTGEIVGSQLRIGSLMAVSPSAGAREIVHGNGIVTPTAIEFSPCGELVVGNDEGGNLSIVDSNGNASWLTDFISYGPPNANITFKQDGTLYVSEAAPGFPDQILEMPVGQAVSQYSNAVKPAGLIMLPDGDLLMAEPSVSQISRIDAGTRQKTALYRDLDFPTAIEQDDAGNLYVITASPELLWDAFWAVPVLGDRILRISPEGEITSLYKGLGLRSLAFGTDGYMYAVLSDRILRISPAGRVESFASGFFDGTDLTFDLAGDLYACDRALNGIVQISGFEQGWLAGTVLDEQGEPLQHARLHILSEEPNLRGKVIYTDDLGHFRAAIAAGRSCSVQVSKPGFRTFIQEDILIENEQTVELTVALEIGQNQ